ncbi:hypothetical protein QL285_031258 [Trifolium repens]|nr:hypothetical protein QL285_031258 [Trifolium repens]
MHKAVSSNPDHFAADFGISGNSAGIPKAFPADFGTPVFCGFYYFRKFRSSVADPSPLSDRSPSAIHLLRKIILRHSQSFLFELISNQLRTDIFSLPFRIKFDFIFSLVFIVVRCLVFLLRRMEHIFSHVYGFACVRCPTRIGIEHDWRHLFRYQRRPLRYVSILSLAAYFGLELQQFELIWYSWEISYGAAQPVQLGSLSNSGAAANGDSGNGRVMLIDGTSVIHRAYYKLLEDSLLHLDFVQSTRGRNLKSQIQPQNYSFHHLNVRGVACDFTKLLIDIWNQDVFLIQDQGRVEHHARSIHHDPTIHREPNIFSPSIFPYCGKANLEKSDLVPDLKTLKDRSIWRSQIVVEKIDAKLLNQQ